MEMAKNGHIVWHQATILRRSIAHQHASFQKWYFVSKIVLTYYEKKNVLCSDQEKHLKFEVEGQEFAKCLRSLEQFIQTVKGQNSFW